jgi:hypothetical protein
MASAVLPDRVDRHPIPLVAVGVALPEGADYEGVAKDLDAVAESLHSRYSPSVRLTECAQNVLTGRSRPSSTDA